MITVLRIRIGGTLRVERDGNGCGWHMHADHVAGVHVEFGKRRWWSHLPPWTPAAHHTTDNQIDMKKKTSHFTSLWRYSSPCGVWKGVEGKGSVTSEGEKIEEGDCPSMNVRHRNTWTCFYRRLSARGVLSSRNILGFGYCSTFVGCV
jgi:hypothetical protein